MMIITVVVVVLVAAAAAAATATLTIDNCDVINVIFERLHLLNACIYGAVEIVVHVLGHIVLFSYPL